ncbi:hypothetical protein ACJRO7_004538 [Eucalyptus globulus]|uniref:Uncharacterized protein n=1 Tax=Eucalyptus globulus TaxID=34317 RepID=A0ABD3IWT1_EUCGL
MGRAAACSERHTRGRRAEARGGGPAASWLLRRPQTRWVFEQEPEVEERDRDGRGRGKTEGERPGRDCSDGMQRRRRRRTAAGGSSDDSQQQPRRTEMQG